MLKAPISLHDSAARSSSGETAAINTLGGNEIGGADDVVFYLNVTASSGTSPTLDITIKATIAGEEWVLGTFTQAVGITSSKITITNCPRDVKVNYAIGGTAPSFTFALSSSR